MVEKLQFGGLEYRLIKRLVRDGISWEYWGAFREIALVRCVCAAGICAFNAELLGWDKVLQIFLNVEVPSQVRIGDRTLDQVEVDNLLTGMHLALRSLESRHAIARRVSHRELSPAERDKALLTFQEWMATRGWKVAIDREEKGMKIIAKWRRLFMRAATDDEASDQARRTAAAFSALVNEPVEYNILFISEGTRYVTLWGELTWAATWRSPLLQNRQVVK